MRKDIVIQNIKWQINKFDFRKMKSYKQIITVIQKYINKMLNKTNYIIFKLASGK